MFTSCSFDGNYNPPPGILLSLIIFTHTHIHTHTHTHTHTHARHARMLCDKWSDFFDTPGLCFDQFCDDAIPVQDDHVRSSFLLLSLSHFSLPLCSLSIYLQSMSLSHIRLLIFSPTSSAHLYLLFHFVFDVLSIAKLLSFPHSELKDTMFPSACRFALILSLSLTHSLSFSHTHTYTNSLSLTFPRYLHLFFLHLLPSPFFFSSLLLSCPNMQTFVDAAYSYAANTGTNASADSVTLPSFFPFIFSFCFRVHFSYHLSSFFSLF